MKKRGMTLQFPSGGLDRKVSFRQTPPYGSRSLKNVRVEEVSTKIMRGGQRPGTDKQFLDELGSGAFINMMGQVTLSSGGGGGSGRLTFSDVFDRTVASGLGGEWETPSWLTQQPDIADNVRGASTSLADSGGAVITTVGVNTSATYSISLDIREDMTGGPRDMTVALYAMLDDTAPNLMKNGLLAMLDLSSAPYDTGIYSGVLIDINDYVPTAYQLSGGTFSSKYASGIFKLEINGTTAKVYWDTNISRTLLTQTISAKAGTSIGYSQNPLSNANASLVSRFLVEGTASTARPNQLRQDVMVVGSGGSVYYESTPGTLSVVGGASISAGHTIQCAQMFQKVYVADYNIAGTGVVYELDTSGPSWSTLTAVSGTVPTNCDMIARWHGRLVLVKDSFWYMCAVNDVTDWQYGRPTATTAISSQNSEAGSLGEPVRATCPASDDLLIFGCDNSIWSLHGDPAWHGRIQNLSKEVGVLDKFAWCFGPAAEMYFLSKDGLYVVPPGGNSRPEPLSRAKIPNELLNIDTGAYEVTLGWSQQEHGVYISVTPYIQSSGYNFFYHAESGTFWGDEYPGDIQPFQMFNYKPIFGEHAALLFGSRDGYVRRINLGATTDDGTNISSYADIGPILLAGDYAEGVVRDLDGYLSAGSGDVTWGLKVGCSSEDVFAQSEFATGTWTGKGLQYRARPRARGHAMVLRLGSEGSAGWSIEKVTAVIESRGRVRR